MRKYILLLSLFLFTQLLFCDPLESLDNSFLKDEHKKPPITPPVAQNKTKNKKTLPKFEDVIKDVRKIEGLFNLYWDEDKNKLLMEVHPEQLGKTYLFNLTRSSGDGYYFDGGSLLWEYAFKLEVIAENLHLLNINTSFRADNNTPINKAITNNLSNSLVGVSKILSLPNEQTGSIIVDGNALFLQDMTYVTQRMRGTYSFDKKNSYFKDIQSYPENTEIEIAAHFYSQKSTNSYTLPDSHSMIHSYHFSLSTLPDSGFTPRLSDDRVGYFTTIYQDYTDAMRETPYVRFINRWNLKKKNPHQILSEPVEPIVFWLENTIPHEYRQAVTDGILAWNIAFEKIGFKNAIVAKQMPDDADWNPGDVRYNTIRWIIQPGGGYAVGPSRANPFTGEIYDADIRISADFVRAFYNEYNEFVNPVTTTPDPLLIWQEEDSINYSTHCNYGRNLNEKMILSWHSLNTLNAINNNQTSLEKYVYNGLVDLVLHEVGHTLGLRHNFKASSIFSVDELSNPEFTKLNGMSGSVMDYHPVSLLDSGYTMFQTVPGPYDIWAIEYGYAESNSINEKIFLEKIANQSTNPLYSYGTDEDAYGLSSRGIDPLCNTWDMSGDPIEYYSRQLDLVQNLWDNILVNFEVEGNRYQKIRSVFNQGISEYYSASRTATKFIGGIYLSRHHIGDPNSENPLEVVSAIDQRKALNFIKDRIFSPTAFSFDPDVLNKLSPERNGDFTGSVWSMDRIDYPLHRVINRVQAVALSSLFHPRRISRVQDNELRMLDDDVFTMHELFNVTRISIWNELSVLENINSFRRNLQSNYINLFKVILLYSNDFPYDAKVLARQNLEITLNEINMILVSSHNLDEYTIAHLESSASNIKSILDATLNTY